MGGIILRAALTVALAILFSLTAAHAALSGALAPLPAPRATGQATTLAVPTGDIVETVTIVRDDWGVPHVYATSLRALFFGNGYIQAEDRFFQMEVLRHVGKGRLAELLGQSGLASDVEVRRELYTEEERREAFLALPAEQRLILESFRDGVNHWLAEVTANPSRMPVEVAALATPPAPWDVTDTVAIAQYLLDVFGAGDGGQELTNALVLQQLRATLGPEAAEAAFRDLYWVRDERAIATIHPSDGTFTPRDSALPFSAIPPEQWALVEAAAGARPLSDLERLGDPRDSALFPLKFGSNAIIVAPQLSESGGALLEGGPQMGYFTPMVPYEVALHGAGFDAVGMGVGGAPGVIIGRGANAAWTVTSGASDQVDVVGVRLGTTPRHYVVDGVERAMACKEESILVRAAPTDYAPKASSTPANYPPRNEVAILETCRTHLGPVFAINEEAGYAFVRERSHRGDELRSGLLWLTLGTVKSLPEFREKLRTFSFEFNFFYTDDTGTIAYFHTGKQPIRSGVADPRLPRPADAAFRWTGFLQGDDLPHIVDPGRGYTVNWNNLPQQGWSSGDAREHWGALHRAQLLEDAMQARLQAKGKVSMADLKAINAEVATRDPYAPHLLPLAVAAAAASADPVVRAAGERLAEWHASGATWRDDGAGRYLDPGHAVWDAWRERVQHLVFEDELAGHVRRLVFDPPTSGDPHAADHGAHGNKDNVLYDAYTGHAAHAWCDDVRTPAVETCEAVALQALEAVVPELVAAFGTTDTFAWRMPIHEIHFVSLSASPVVKLPMRNQPSFNHFYDWGTLEMGSALPPGTASGYYPPATMMAYLAGGEGALPAHHRDQLALYRDFQFKPVRFAAEDVLAHKAWERTLVVPPALA